MSRGGFRGDPARWSSMQSGIRTSGHRPRHEDGSIRTDRRFPASLRSSMKPPMSSATFRFHGISTRCEDAARSRRTSWRPRIVRFSLRTRSAAVHRNERRSPRRQGRRRRCRATWFDQAVPRPMTLVPAQPFTLGDRGDGHHPDIGDDPAGEAAGQVPLELGMFLQMPVPAVGAHEPAALPYQRHPPSRHHQIPHRLERVSCTLEHLCPHEGHRDTDHPDLTSTSSRVKVSSNTLTTRTPATATVSLYHPSPSGPSL